MVPADPKHRPVDNNLPEPHLFAEQGQQGNFETYQFGLQEMGITGFFCDGDPPENYGRGKAPGKGGTLIRNPTVQGLLSQRQNL